MCLMLLSNKWNEINGNFLKKLFPFLQETEASPMNHKVLFTQPLRSGRIWHKVNF